MKDSQPAWALRDKDETANVRAVHELLARSLRPASSIVEFFGGIGGVARRVRALYPCLPYTTWDMDERCVEELGLIEGVEVVGGDSIRDCTPPAGAGVLMDFNVWTLLRARTVYKDCMERVFLARPNWVQIADSALSRLHLNYDRAYGMAEPTWEAYQAALRGWARSYGWALVDEERAHHKTVMLLFVPIKKALPRSR